MGKKWPVRQKFPARCRDSAHNAWPDIDLRRQRGATNFLFLSAVPEARVLRDFVIQIYRLFDPEQSPHQAACRRAALVKDPQYLADPDLARALAMLSPEKFAKMMAFLHCPKCRQVRTNNHVERTNRRLRYLEKVRYKWRRRRTIVRFVVLALDRWRRDRRVKKVNSVTKHQPPQGQSAGTQAT
jgi:hypothetical protein